MASGDLKTMQHDVRAQFRVASAELRASGAVAQARAKTAIPWDQVNGARRHCDQSYLKTFKSFRIQINTTAPRTAMIQRPRPPAAAAKPSWPAAQ